MWMLLQTSQWIDNPSIFAAWLVTIGLLIAGMIGCIIPVLPGHFILLMAAVAHRMMLGQASGLHTGSFILLILLMIGSQILETVSGAAGSRWFGGSRWGVLGAIAGSLIGLFFFPIGLFVGPLLGAFLCEAFFAKKSPQVAMKSGVGSFFGVLAGMGIKIIMGFVMLVWILLCIFHVLP